MNKKNNKKYQETEKLICNTFLDLLEEKRLSGISITEICTKAAITRATFYAHSKDLHELMKKTDAFLSKDLIKHLYEYNISHRSDWELRQCFVQLFQHVKKHQNFYRIYISYVPIFPLFSTLPDFYLQLSGEDIYKKSHLDELEQRKLLFHSSFFYAGMTAFLRIWLESGCKESIDEMLLLINEQYHQKAPEVKNDLYQDIIPASGIIPGAEQT